MPGSSSPRRVARAQPSRSASRVVGAALALGLSLGAAPAWAAPAATGGSDAAESPAVDSESADADAGEVAPDDAPQPTVTEVEREPAPTGGGVAGAIVDPNDPNASRAQSDLEGESLDTTVEGLPERLPRLQAAGWWTTFGAVALATTGGVLAGIAEARQDQADRLAYSFDLETGRAPVYAEVADEYEQLLRDGTTYQNLGRGFLIAGGVTLVAGIVLFSMDGAQRRRARREDARVALEPGAGGLRLRF